MLIFPTRFSPARIL